MLEGVTNVQQEENVMLSSWFHHELVMHRSLLIIIGSEHIIGSELMIVKSRAS